MKSNKIKKFQQISKLTRIYSLISIYFAKSGHPGGSLSVVDILNYIFLKHLKIKSLNDFRKINRNRFILSKGHAVPALYSLLAANKILKFNEILGLRKIDSVFQGHPNKLFTPFVEASTGSLGHGFSYAVGQALAYKKLKINKTIFVVVGDGEMQEGQIWEGLILSKQLKLDNLVIILDYNKIQSDDFVKNISNIEPLGDKIKSFGCNVIEINGHSFNEIDYAFNKKFKNNNPKFIIANTIKGKGVSFMENVPSWHGSVKMSLDQIINSLIELKAEKKLIKLCEENYEN